MGLSEYKKKRKFNQTPEPVGEVSQKKGPLTFVIQKHQASRLHYDFRLEVDGVLKSWAVPKGPSLNPEDKRLAMMVEDHPMDYESFEGIIPAGNYGAGTVMVWDRGVYGVHEGIEREDSEKILRQQLEKGHLTFILLGEKLKGEYGLIKTPHAGENAWLLIKAGDEYATNKDILEKDNSVLTSRSMKQIASQAEKKNEVWISKPKDLDLGDAPKGLMPKEIKPMLASVSEKPFNNPDWIFEIKWDGYRTIAQIESGKVKLYSRNGQSFNAKFAPVLNSLGKFPGNAVLDGEVVVLNSKGHPDFHALQDYPKSKGELVYYVFDLLHFDGYNLEKLPLIKRKEILKKILPPLPNISYSDHIEEHGIEFFTQATKLELEGIMAKKANSTYKEGARGEDWLKLKTHLTEDAVIAGYTSPKGSRQHFGALVLGSYAKDGKLKYIGHTGGGFDDKTLKMLLNKLEPLEVDECAFETKPVTNAPAKWVKPVLVCEITFSNWTKDRRMRHPIFLRMRDDKNPQEASEPKVFGSVAPDKGEAEEMQIGRRTLKLTNLSKVFWPKEGYTKGDLISYYKEIASIILPYLKNRPESLLRFPNGIEGENFFQKDASSLKVDWLMRGRVHSKSEKKDIDYLLCQDEASLIYLINLGCIDLNPWNSRIEKLEKPDYLVIDLDPEDIDFKSVVIVALKIRDFLEGLGIESYPKTSGATGMHIYIPMGAKYDYDQVRSFAELLCIQIHHQLPDLTSIVRSPKDRQKRVYLDYLQNRRGQTLASVYSVRAKVGATVSTPLKWEEVIEKLHPRQFTIKNTPKRLEKMGDLFKGVLGKGINIEKVLKKLER